MDAANYWHDKYQELKEVVGIDADEIRQLRTRVKELEAALKKIAALPSYIPATQAALIATEALNP